MNTIHEMNTIQPKSTPAPRRVQLVPGPPRAASPGLPARSDGAGGLHPLLRLLAGLAALAAASGAGGLHGDAALPLGWDSPGGGLALEAAVRNGFFAEEGIEVSAVRIRPGDFAGALADGRIAGGELDGSVVAFPRDGIPAGPAAGLYSGFLEIRGLRNQPERVRLAVESLGGGPAVAAARHYRERGIDPASRIDWVTVPPDELAEAVLDGRATAFARWEARRAAPAGGHGAGAAGGHGDGLAEGHAHGGKGHSHGGGKEHGRDGGGHAGQGDGVAGGSGAGAGDERLAVIFSASALLPPPPEGGSKAANPHAGHTASHHFFTSFAVLGRDLYDRDPGLAAAAVRAWIRGAAWVGNHRSEAARIGIEAGIWDGDAASLEREIARYMWMPGVAHAKEHLRSYIHEWVGRGLLPPGTDEGGYFDRLFIQALPDLN
ncbi:MAG: hypothetical protein LBG06_11135 [Deltaproteobacteria bacterium]|jgi:ABC-type nitrate/sulfonate/bicarbonate transport system substrate-binding protein|nr:hypothetical protein [Deltaproteobacteria bacterium]